MAEAVLFNIADGIISKLGSLILKEIGIWWGVKDELDKLNRSVSTIKAVLLHAEEQSMENPQVKNWVAMLSDVIYDADDLVDEVSTEALRQKLTSGSKMGKKVRLFFSTSNNFASGLKLGHKIKAIRDRLDEIAATRKFHLDERSESVGRVFAAKGRDQTHSSPPEVVIGREHEKETIVEILLSSDYEENVAVVPIVGIGGLGKTTLAQLVYNDDKIKKHFELMMWVCVSDQFDVKLIVKKILESASRRVPDNAEMDPLKTLLHEEINGRRYLLVLDDVWNEDLNKWFNLKDLLAGGARGSKIVITTRLRKVAEMSRPVYVHELGGLPETKAWSLFKQMAFKRGKVPNPSHEAMGREIAAKCYGVPLVIKTIGGMLYFKDLESEWLLFKNTELLKVNEYKNDILSILKLSYNHLPSHYKHCFAICSLYPKDYEFQIGELMHLWMAQGYLKSSDPNESCEDIGFRYFMDLFRMTFFQDVEYDLFGDITNCKMHDLMHDLAISVAGDNFSVSHSKITFLDDKSRHISFEIGGDSAVHDFSSLLKARKTRTVLPFVSGEAQIKEEEMDALFCNLRCLRVMDLSYVGINYLPSSIFKLIHLRHLDISYNRNIKKLPDSITNLLNLQVLILRGCRQLIELPNNIAKLVNLVHLHNDYCHELTHMPQGIGQLTRLEKLSSFVVAKDNSMSKKSGGLAELKGLNNFRGRLQVKNLKYVKNVKSECKAANLSAKQQLTELSLHWNEYKDDNVDCSAQDVSNDEMGLEALQPHQSLKGLSVFSYRGVRPPSWLPSLTHLVSICFENCKSIQWLPAFDCLPYLKHFWMFTLTNLDRIYIENGEPLSFFPSLTDLRITNCPNLKGFMRCNNGVGMNQSSISMEELPCFPCVSTLEIGDCMNLNHMPLFPHLKILKLRQSLKEILKKATSPLPSTSSPFFSLSQLEHLSIMEMEDFPEDELLPYLTSLQHLEFYRSKFKGVASDEKDGGVKWQSLRALTSIAFGYMYNLASIPKGLQHVTSLQSLRIRNCCSMLSIPDWMTNLISLQHLTIIECPLLSERCKNNLAEDWPKISHIPNISIDHRRVQTNGCYLL